jgi:hypothetical protein
MKISIKEILLNYFDIWWLPAVSFFGLLLLFTLAVMTPWWPLNIFGLFSIPVIGFSFIGVLTAAIHLFQEERFGGGVFNLLMVPICVLAFWYIITLWFVFTLMQQMD